MNVGDKTFCIYQYSAEQAIYPDLGDAGVAGKDSSLLQWMQDTVFSGKWVHLTPGSAFTAESSGNHSLSTLFRLTGALQTLQDDNRAIQIVATQDMTNSEALEVPVMVVSGAPPPILVVESESDVRFLLPSFSPEARTDYAVCGGRGILDDVAGHASDSRFAVVHEDLQEPGSCGTVKRREYRSVFKEDSGCKPWCELYLPRSGRYDVAVTHSPSACFQFALDLHNASALRNALVMILGAKKNACLDEGWLTKAIRLNFSAGVEELLEWGASPDKSFQGLTPLQAAAAQGNIEALGQLLNRSQDVTARSSALVAAGSHCHARAMELLKDHGATVDGKPKCEDSVLLRVVEQHAMNTQVCQQPAKSVTGVAQNYTALWDVLSILQQMDPASAQNCRGLALRKALSRTDLAALDQLLDRVEKVDQLKGAGGPLAPSLANLLSKGTFTDEGFLKAATLLHAHGMDLEPKRRALLPFVADLCNLPLVKGLLNLGAKPEGVYVFKNASTRASESKMCAAETDREAILDELLKASKKAHA